jgi:hypothetical protein
MNKSNLSINNLIDREMHRNIEMPPIEEIQNITQALANDRTPNVAQQQVQVQQVSDEFPTTNLDELPQYEEGYNPQEVEVPSYEQEVQPQTQAGPEPQVQKSEQESVQARNFRELRMQAAQAARERDELLAYIRQMEEQKKAAPVIQEEPEADLQFDPEDVVSGKQLNDVAKQLKNINKRLAQTQVQSEEAKRLSYEAEVERTMRRLYPDFDEVVSETNIRKFREQYAPLANSIARDTDFYNKCNSVYLALKNTGIPKSASYQPQVDKIKQNMAKPRPVTSIGAQQAESPLTRVNAFAEGMTPELQKELIKEMNAARMKI